MEDAWLRCEREFFVDNNAIKLDILPKTLNKILEAYNKALQKDLIDESPYVAEDLKLTILKSREKNEREQEDPGPREADSET